MITGRIPILSSQAHRRIDQLAFPTLLATAALLARRSPTAGSVALLTAAVEGTAYVITDYPPAGILPLISFRTHNQWAVAHGFLIGALALALPRLSRRDRGALCTLATMPILLAVVSETRTT